MLNSKVAWYSAHYVMLYASVLCGGDMLNMLGSLHFSGTQMDPYYVNLFRRPRKENDWQPFGVGDLLV